MNALRRFFGLRASAVRKALGIVCGAMLCGAIGCSSLPPLEDAISRDDTNHAVQMINQGQGLNELDAAHRTPLHWAAFQGNVEVTKLLITKGASIETKADGNATPLYYACLRAQVATAQVLLDHGAVVDSPDVQGWTPLMVACKILQTPDAARQPAAVTTLLARGANPNAHSHEPWTPLHVAAELSEPVVAKILIDHGANVTAVGNFGYQPIDNAALMDHQATAFLLFDAGAVASPTPSRPEAGARAYRLAAIYVQTKGRVSDAAEDYRIAAAEFLKQVTMSRNLAKQDDANASNAFWGGLGEAVLFGALAGATHSNITYVAPNPDYWWTLKDQANANADACQKFADDCSAKAASLQTASNMQR